MMETFVKIKKLAFVMFVVISEIILIACSGEGDVNDKNKGTENVYEATGTVDGHEYVDLGLSVSWATCNIGAGSPYENGNYYPFYYCGTQSAQFALMIFAEQPGIGQHIFGVKNGECHHIRN